MLKLSNKLGKKLYHRGTKEYLFTLVKVDGTWLDGYSVNDLPEKFKGSLDEWGEEDTYGVNEETDEWASEDDFYSEDLTTEASILKEKEIKEALFDFIQDCKTPFIFDGKDIVAGHQATHYAQQKYAYDCGWIYSSICEEVEFDD